MFLQQRFGQLSTPTEYQLKTVLSIRNGRRVYAAAINTESEVSPVTESAATCIFNSIPSGFGVFFSDIRLACAEQLNFLTGRAWHRVKRRPAPASHQQRLNFTQKLPQLIDIERRGLLNRLTSCVSLPRVTSP